MTNLKKVKENKLWIIDLDDTLFHQDINIRAYRRVPCRGKGETLELVKTIHSSKWKLHDIDDSLEYDFSDFKDERSFIDNAKPIGNNYQRILDMGAAYGYRHIVTAREQFYNQLYFVYHIQHRLWDDELAIHCVGDYITNEFSPPKAKQKTIRNLIKEKDYLSDPYQQVYMFDDCTKNLHAFMRLQEEFTYINFKAYEIRGSEFVEYTI
jgi:hypothetical protein